MDVETLSGPLAFLLILCWLPVVFRRDPVSLLFSIGLMGLCVLLYLLPIKPFAMCLALSPVAIYLLLIGGLNLYRRPFLVSGMRDAAAMAAAVSGLMIVGPAELFFPLVASIRFGAFVWLLLAVLYALTVVLLLLTFRPRLVIYNITAEELRPVLGNAVTRLDPDARWAGDGLHLPKLGVQLHLESLGFLRNVSLVAGGPAQNHQGWQALEKAMAAALGDLEVPRNTRAGVLVSAGLILLLFIVLTISHDPQAVAKALYEMFQV